MSEVKLKPCPFCGREATTSIVISCGNLIGSIRFLIRCPACKIELCSNYIQSYGTFDEAEKAKQKVIENWNRRINNDRQRNN